ncbi:hypothetical protein [Paracoccus pantotrophus]|uniref:hypothetical protein n=1 Tax=Paracoccus pantotrophus TaxID=82367 RepID=UPI0008F32294|nr:hypothetical protein [Paracoccus pantotrophus]MDF3854216.1 hypothetical protein [Paracoccus pantotrophus]SFO27317.1 hypothetical protein SAMN04244567_01255 [Paracoccus pantotrophus]
MPNVKIYIDETRLAACRAAIEDALPRLRDLLCERLAVEASACQIAVLPVLGLPDQPQVNAELLILPRSGRTPERIRAVAGTMRQVLEQASGLDVAVRVGMLDPETYLALK